MALYLMEKYEIAKTRYSQLLGLSLSTLSYLPTPKDDVELSSKLETLAGKHRRFGHPRLFVFLKKEMPEVNHKRSHRVYTKLELQIGRRKRKKLGTHSRLPPTRATQPDQVWAIDFMFDYLETGLKFNALFDDF